VPATAATCPYDVLSAAGRAAVAPDLAITARRLEWLIRWFVPTTYGSNRRSKL
jgi:hypothetical protein